MKPEARVLAACLRHLASLAPSDALHWLKTAGGPHQTSGQPDLLICRRGRFIAAELKAPGGAPTPLQAHRLDQWRQAGAIAGCVTSVEELQELLERAT